MQQTDKLIFGNPDLNIVEASYMNRAQELGHRYICCFYKVNKEESYNLLRSITNKMIEDAKGKTLGVVTKLHELANHSMYIESDLFCAVTELVHQSPRHAIIYIMYKDIDNVQKLFHDLQKIADSKHQKQDEITIQYAYKSAQRIGSRELVLSLSGRRAVIDGLHPGINVKQLIKDFLDGEEALMIFTGLPGTGKTTIMKQLMMEANSRAIDDIIYANSSELVDNSDFWSYLQDFKDPLLLLDDIDPSILEGRNNTTTVQSMLGYCDGILEHGSKVVISANCTKSAIDPRLLRPGRCFSNIEVLPLTVEQANSIWKDILKMDVTKFPSSKIVYPNSTKATITQAEIVAAYKAIKKQINVPVNSET